MGEEVPIEHVQQLDVDSLDQNRLFRRVVLSPYIPGLSERLKIISNRYQLKSWHTYSGRIGDALTVHKDKIHPSKSRFVMYNALCSCGMRYIGETGRN